jgi:hypothetical protein
MTAYQVVFDEAVVGYREWYFPAGLVLSALWLVLMDAAVRHFNRRAPAPSELFPRWVVPVSLAGAISGSAIFIPRTYPPHATMRDALRIGDFHSVEGTVREVKDGDPGMLRIASGDGRQYEFHYSEHRITPGYRPRHSLVRVGARVRVAEVDGHIARLEVARDTVALAPATHAATRIAAADLRRQATTP